MPHYYYYRCNKSKCVNATIFYCEHLLGFYSFLFVNFVLNFFTTMAKKTSATKNNNKRIPPIDRVPKHSQQPRSSPPKRRTDFSFFIRNPSSISNPAIGMQFLFFLISNFLQLHNHVLLSWIIYYAGCQILLFDWLF